MPSARILAVDDEEGMLQLLAETLLRDGFRVVTAAGAPVALERAATTSFDLVVSDVALPGMNGLDLRDALHRISGHENTPFLFVSAMDPVIETDLARRLGKDKLLAKPFTRAELRRAIYGALKLARVTVGPIATTIDRIFLEVADQQGTGVVTAVSGPVTKRVVLEEGKAVFAFSNDPRDLIGQAFIRAGLITENDLLEAFALWNDNPASRGTPGLATALGALRKVTPEQSRAVFEKKIREAILDLYLWRDGMVEFVEGEIAEDERPFPIALDVATLRRDGAKRQQHWDDANALVPDRSQSFRRAAAPLPAGFPVTAGDRALLGHLEAGRTLAEILVEFRGQDYGIVMRVADLVRRGCFVREESKGFRGAAPVEHIDVSTDFDSMFGDLGAELAREEKGGGSAAVASASASAPAAATPAAAANTGGARTTVPSGASPSGRPPSAHTNEESLPPDPEVEREIAARFADALVKMRSGDLQGARAGFLRVLEGDPFNTLARERLEETETLITAAARRAGLKDDHRLRLAIPVQELVGRHIPPADAFVISRLAAGPHTVGELLHVCPFPEHQVLEILVRHLGSGVLARNV